MRFSLRFEAIAARPNRMRTATDALHSKSMSTELSAAQSRDSRPVPENAEISGRGSSVPVTFAARADAPCYAALGLLWVVMAFLAKPIGDFPINDDWVYGLSVKALL